MTGLTWGDANRDPSADPTPLDWASFYVEDLKYGAGPGQLEVVQPTEIVGQFETLLRDAGVDSMTGEELSRAVTYYGKSLSNSIGINRTVALSLFVDGLMHGIALAGGIKGEHRGSRR